MSRVARRAKKRLACALIVGRQRFSGVILDLSSTGVFIQTTARPAAGEAVALEVGIPGRKETVRLQAEVVRLKVVPAQLLNLAQGGVGLRITSAPDGYFEFLGGALARLAPREEDQPQEPSPAAPPARESGPKPPPAREARAAVPPGIRSAGSAAASAPRMPSTRGFRVRVREVGGARSRMLRLRAASAGEAAAAGLREVGAGWKVLDTAEDPG